jgi:hypothetical protein
MALEVVVGGWPTDILADFWWQALKDLFILTAAPCVPQV